MERKIGEVFKFNGELIVAVEDIVGNSKCKKCYLYDLCRLYPWDIDRNNNVGSCGRYDRSDDKSVFFRKVNDMEQKSIKIQVPEGYKIDKENSTFEEIKFKPIKNKKLPTYEDIMYILFNDKVSYWINNRSSIICNTLYDGWAEVKYPNNCTSHKQAEKLLAINKLMNLAKYLNEGWIPNWNDDIEQKWFIFLIKGNIDYHALSTMTFTTIVFRTKELAQQAVEILGEDTIRLALCTDY